MTSSVNTTTATPEAKTKNPLKQLLSFGQSVWLDYIRRDLMTSGELARLINEDGLRGMTSNPTIFEKAISGSKDYAPYLQELVKKGGLDEKGIYEQIAIRDIQDAADALRSVYDQTNGRDGYVSLECAPTLANKTQETLDEARRLWKSVGRPNVMIKVPGTAAGIPAIQQLVSEGLNINITLLFAQDVYEEVAWAYISGLEELARKGGDLSRVASVASFFVSRIDTLVDSKLDGMLNATQSAEEKSLLQGLKGKVAIANAKLAYQSYENIFSSPRWKAMSARGAKTQRVLWASTGTKNPAYSDVLYVDELIGPDTVNTVPPATLDAYRDHGHPSATLQSGVDDAGRTMQDLVKAGISMKQVTDQLTEDGVKLFEEAFAKLLAAVREKMVS